MTQVQQLEKSGREAVSKLRRNKLSHGHPFMIHDRKLSQNECYMEYPDGRICIVKLAGADSDFEVVRQLTQAESARLRHAYHLS